MDGRKLILYNVLFFLLTRSVEGRVTDFGLDENSRKSKQLIAVIPGIKMYYKHGEIGVEFSLRDFFSRNAAEGRAGGGGGGGAGVATGGGDGSKKTGPIRRIIRTLMMIPFAIQIFSLPGVLAEIKMSLLRSVVVAKMALILLIVNAFRNGQTKEIVVVHKAPPAQHYDHYYHPYPSENENENEGWFGR